MYETGARAGNVRHRSPHLRLHSRNWSFGDVKLDLFAIDNCLLGMTEQKRRRVKEQDSPQRTLNLEPIHPAQTMPRGAFQSRQPRFWMVATALRKSTIWDTATFLRPVMCRHSLGTLLVSDRYISPPSNHRSWQDSGRLLSLLEKPPQIPQTIPLDI